MAAPLSTHIPGAAGDVEVVVTGTLIVNTGLREILTYGACLAEDAAISGDVVSVTLTKASAGKMATLTLKVWKRTAAGDCTPIAATAAKKVTWFATGV